jgi:hypothetical protein
MMRMETEHKMKITVHATTIRVFEGVQTGRLIDLYHTLPASAKYDEAEAVITTSSGIRI